MVQNGTTVGSTGDKSNLKLFKQMAQRTRAYNGSFQWKSARIKLP